MVKYQVTIWGTIDILSQRIIQMKEQDLDLWAPQHGFVWCTKNTHWVLERKKALEVITYYNDQDVRWEG